jgi:hypothetical protein
MYLLALKAQDEGKLELHPPPPHPQYHKFSPSYLPDYITYSYFN